MAPSAMYRGFKIVWDKPPYTTAQYDMSVSSNDVQLQARLERFKDGGGPHLFNYAGSIDSALLEARRFVDRILR